ncbi:MAG: hypothetical protein V9G19_19040 [Tetrasphaera sp.]
MRRIVSFSFIALATFGIGSTAAEASPAGSGSTHPAISLQRAQRPVVGAQRGTITARITAWHPKGAACIICWQSGR